MVHSFLKDVHMIHMEPVLDSHIIVTMERGKKILRGKEVQLRGSRINSCYGCWSGKWMTEKLKVFWWHENEWFTRSSHLLLDIHRSMVVYVRFSLLRSNWNSELEWGRGCLFLVGLNSFCTCLVDPLNAGDALETIWYWKTTHAVLVVINKLEIVSKLKTASELV